MLTRICKLGLVSLAVFFSSSALCGDRFIVTNVAPDLLLISTDRGSYSNNSLVFTGPQGVLLVDTHHKSDAPEFKAFVEALGFGPPSYIVNTHRHVEHIGGNAVFGDQPIIVAHQLFAEKLRSGTHLFSEYPDEVFPDLTFTESMEINFNDETIRLVNIGGSHDDNEIMVYFKNHRVAHISSVVNGFNFPSVDSDGDVLRFEPITRELMKLLPPDTQLISGHHGSKQGFDQIGSWDQLSDYADMMKNTIDLVQLALEEGVSQQQMEERQIFKAYEHYAGSYVSSNDWINYVVDALTVPRDIREDICKPLFETWKTRGARAAAEQYRQLLETDEDQYDFSEYVLLGIGSNLYTNNRYQDAVTFLKANIETYPDSESSYYSHYLTAKGLQELDHQSEAIAHARESLRLNGEFQGAQTLLAELTADDQ